MNINMNLNIAILEDNEQDFQLLEHNLKQWCSISKNVINVSWFPSEENIYEEFKSKNFDILFSDIELNTSVRITGMEICAKLRKNGYAGEIIFLTAFSEYVFEGYNVNAFNYLLKPIILDNLLACMNRYSALHMSDYYYYHKGTEIIKLPYNNILFFLKDNHDVIIQLLTGIYTERVTLNEIENHLPAVFQRCHRSCIINMLHVRSLVANTIYFSNNSTQTIGRKYLEPVRKKLIELSQN